MSHRRHPIWKALALWAIDTAVVAGALAFAYWVRFHSGLVPVTKGYDPALYAELYPWAVLSWFLAFRFENLYRRRAKLFDFAVVRRVITGSIFALLMIFAFIYFYRGFVTTDFSRLFIPVAFCSVVGWVLLERIALHLFYARLARDRGVGLTRTLIVGAGPLGARVYRRLIGHPEHGMAPLGMAVDPEMKFDETESPGNIPVLGEVGELPSILAGRRIEEIVLVQPEVRRELIPTILTQCEHAMASFRIVPDTAALLISGLTVETLDGIPFLGGRETPLQGWNAALKRAVDFAAAAVGLVVLSPVMAAIAWLVRREDGGPIFYLQERMGIDGERFRIIKFRTMRLDAEARTGPVFADDDDDRCTRVGCILRRYRLDELPQLVNVLRGEMSLVGPRPERPYFIERFKGDIPRYMTRHRVRSGITGWAQINGLAGKHGTIQQRLEYDLYYIENWSLWLDLKILFITLVRAGNAG